MFEGRIGRRLARSLLVALLGVGFVIAGGAASNAAPADAETGYITQDHTWG